MTELMVAAQVAPREKFTTIYSGMEVDSLVDSAVRRDAMRAQLGYRPDDVVIGKIARLFHLKGHCYVIRAARGVGSPRGRRRSFCFSATACSARPWSGRSPPPV